jgi:hypothetical protein
VHLGLPLLQSLSSRSNEAPAISPFIYPLVTPFPPP